MPAATEHPSSDPTWFVYIVRCRDRTLYTGITTDLRRRLKEHNAGRGAKYTRPRRPVELVYSEEAATRSAAAGREYRLKRLSLNEKNNLIATASALSSADDPIAPPETEPVSGQAIR